MKKIKINKTSVMMASFACAGIGCLVSIAAIASLTIIENNSNNIYFANYQSYMDNDLIKNLESDNHVQYKTYGTSEQLESSFSENYDIAIPTTYSAVKMIKEKQLKKLNWNLLTNCKYKTAAAALELFNEEVKTLLQSYDWDDDGKNDNLLEYGVPYFAQEVVFGYKKNNETKLGLGPNSDWSSILTKLASFKDLKNGSIVTLNDPRTMYGISNLYHGLNNINPQEDKTIDNFRQKYDYLSSYDNRMIFRSDSGEIINNLADPKGNQYSLLYNGDLIYAIQGGDNYDGNGEKLCYIKPNNTVIALDMMVVNAKTKVPDEDVSKVIAKIGLNADVSDLDNNWTLKNFNYIQYTPPLKDIYNKVTQSEYWTSWPSEQVKQFTDLLKLSNTNVENLIEQPIDNFVKSNMEIAFSQAIGSLW